jgi:putative N6-adenine-specific DNA methylase
MSEQKAEPPPFFATAAKGTEGALRDELRELRFRQVRADRGGVFFGGRPSEGFRACLELRTAMRVHERLAEFHAPDGEALYEGVRSLDFTPFLSPQHTLLVRASCRSSQLTHTQFIAQKTKDAIVDRFRDETGERPSVDKIDPDVVVFVHLVKDVATIYVDLAGESLHRRGYRRDAGEAPIKETLAAAIVRLGGWDRARPLVDPMCGSGTIAIEAALWAQDVAPGLFRKRFGFERWASHGDEATRAIEDLRAAARARRKSEAPPIFASDIDALSVASVADICRRTGARVITEERDVRDISPTTPAGHVITNPPYDERLAVERGFFYEMGKALCRLRGHRLSVLAGSPDIADGIPRRPVKALAVWNGDIECRLLDYEV